MKIHSTLYSCALLLLLLTSWQDSNGQTTTFNMDDKANPYVLIQLKPVSSKQDSLKAAKAIKAGVEQIKSINTKLGYEPFDKKIASFTLTANGKKTTYLAVRNFKDFTDAEAYSYDIWKEIPKGMYGKIAEPFPISPANYKTCVAEKDFAGYFKYYNSTRK